MFRPSPWTGHYPGRWLLCPLLTSACLSTELLLLTLLNYNQYPWRLLCVPSNWLRIRVSPSNLPGFVYPVSYSGFSVSICSQLPYRQISPNKVIHCLRTTLWFTLSLTHGASLSLANSPPGLGLLSYSCTWAPAFALGLPSDTLSRKCPCHRLTVGIASLLYVGSCRGLSPHKCTTMSGVPKKYSWWLKARLSPRFILILWFFPLSKFYGINTPQLILDVKFPIDKWKLNRTLNKDF